MRSPCLDIGHSFPFTRRVLSRRACRPTPGRLGTPRTPASSLTSLLAAVFVAAVVLATSSSSSIAADHGHESPAKSDGAPLFNDLGNHNHSITTVSPQAQRYFNQGLTLAYAFNHAEAERSFREAARLDPDCAMAWWGVALVLGPNINKPMDDADVPKAWDALKKAQACAAKASEKERAYINALAKRYGEQPVKDRATLDLAYADVMRELVKQYPDDLDAATLFAEAVMDTSPWHYWTVDKQPKPTTRDVLAALESVLQRKNDHPGACHLYIHAVEAAFPEKALPAADTLRTLVPGAGHLVHMPAHIYLRLGLYREATLMNELASKADESYISQCRAQGFYPAGYYPHNLHFLWYTNAMEGRSRQSIESVGKIIDHGKHGALAEGVRFEPLMSMALVRFGKWDQVLLQPTPPADKLFESAMSHYTRGLAFAGKRELDSSAAELKALQAIAASEDVKKLESPILPATVLIQIAVHDLGGHLAMKKGANDQAVAELRKAVELEDTLPYMEPPFCYMPMRHGLGVALLSAGQAAEAEKVYRQDLANNPNNGWSLFGLSQALKAQDKKDLADEVMQRFNLAWIRADVKLTSSRY